MRTPTSIFVSAVAIAMSPAANAQTGDAAAAADGPGELEDIVVTGSRIARRTVESNSPLTSIGADRLQISAETNIVRQLQTLPAFAPGRSPTGGEASAFTGSFVDLRGLGRARTLTLVDGRRWINTISDGGVDYSTIPPELIERVEIVTGGASATYGSDAVAGVVNIILRKKFDGLEANAQTGLTDRGESTNTRFSLTGGDAFAAGRGNFFVHGSYDRTRLLTANGRSSLDPAVVNENGQLRRFDFDDAIDAGSALVDGVRTPFSANGELFSAPGVTNPLNDSDLFNEGRFARVQIPARKYSLAAGFDYELTDSVKLYGQGIYVHEETRIPRSPDGRDLSGISISTANPFLGPLTQSYLTTLDTDGDGLVTVPGLARRFSELGGRARLNDRNSYRFLAGAEIELGGDWKVDGSAVFSASRFTIRTQGNIHNARLAQALDVVAGPNGPDCREQFFGEALRCAPLDIFGAGGISKEAASFISTEGGLNGRNTDMNLQLIATGTVLNLPAGPLGVAFGVEHRNSKAAEIPNEVWRTGQSSDILGEFSSGLKQTEVFGEALVPLFSDAAFAKYLGLELGVRYTRFSPGTDAWTYKALGDWTVTDFLKLRGGVQRATRAPNPFELGGGDQLFAPLGAIGGDPCFTGAPLTGDLLASCVANGVPAPIATTGGTASPTLQVRNTFFGNPQLKPEIAKTWTVGTVLQYPGISGLSLTVDYYNIRLDGVITSVGVPTIYDQCYASGSGGSDPLCAKIQRNTTTGLIRTLDDGPVNAGSFQVSGVDIGFGYAFKLDGFSGSGATAGINLTATRLIDFVFRPFAEQPDLKFACAGRYGPTCRDPRPKWKSNTQLSYTDGPVSAAMTWTWIGSAADEAAAFDPDTVADLARTRIGSKHYFDLNVVWRVSKAFELRAGVENLTDVGAPVVGIDRSNAAVDNSTFPGLYDTLGRRFFFGGKLRI